MSRMTKYSVALLIGFAAFGQVGFSHAHAPEPALVSADKVMVFKSLRRLVLLRNGKAIRWFRIALGREPVGPKVRKGDGRTPEGRYVLDWRNAKSRFYRSIHVSYPAPADKTRARKLGASPGGDIMIHGLPPRAAAIGADHAKWDWTEGCIAVTNEEMDEIWARVGNGTPIEILP